MNKVLSAFRLSVKTLVILEKLSLLERRNITNALETAILEKGIKMKIDVKDVEIEKKHQELIKKKEVQKKK